MVNFEIIIGIENHVELKTQTKMFSAAQVSYGAVPNSMVNEVCLGYPGAMPTLNKKGVELAILAVNALNMELDTLLKFDRKNYFYPDLAKGFQITQQFNPIGKNGSLDISLSDQTTKVIDIERLHMEEDTAKQIHKDNLTYIDYNRSGIGLIEIVTRPVMRSADEAVAYVEKLREILLFLGVSDVKMNEGSLRTDLNISLRPFGATTYSNKVEVKNLNSISNMRKAIEFEVKRQTKILLKNKIVEQETRRFDDTTQETVSMRSKSDALDYKYFREPNIAPIQLNESWVADIIAKSPELPDQKRVRYTSQYGLTIEDVDIILSSLEMTMFFEEALKLTTAANKIANFLISDVQSELNRENKAIDEIALTPANLAEMINLVEQGIISSKHTKTILPLILNNSIETPKQIVDRLNLKLISDEIAIAKMLKPIIASNSELIAQYNERPERVTKTIMGQLMKVSQGNVNPDVAMKIIIGLVKHN
ncbi:Asp-tRNA(Asn)/Glu-tRNA(Gln) amidotransferase subunit GatB [Mesoplasma syrphidae]|uniref:Aspartyl/glutamyl-tRNA(Asn/Gln) amidotransferase subunit B n=1 Tax=Mesoplasma syrphidae TaxID=225999 RepID=A0A2K9C9W5_9MOLU|nr:Asp-tRNA(Asn)/Glu-tRNA(Gln) amidotransferase subunit GatB [Mesoplasma syrphidae]AUF83805.1 Asp-tRNA(Asn)/Glu-tRNA(Gln) amidotransferase subunit GatB [Mesoplasma syrphidae]